MIAKNTQQMKRKNSSTHTYPYTLRCEATSEEVLITSDLAYSVARCAIEQHVSLLEAIENMNYIKEKLCGYFDPINELEQFQYDAIVVMYSIFGKKKTYELLIAFQEFEELQEMDNALVSINQYDSSEN